MLPYASSLSFHVVHKYTEGSVVEGMKIPALCSELGKYESIKGKLKCNMTLAVACKRTDPDVFNISSMKISCRFSVL
jgi:hypothetical protein